MNGWLYDAVAGIAERRLLSGIRADLLSQLRGEIVEVGAGTGASFPYYDPSARLLAIEPDPSMAARAVRHMAENGPRISLLGGDDAVLDTLPKRSVDHVVATLVLCSVENPALTLRRIRRVLRPQGTYVFLEHCRAHGFSATVQDRLTPLWGRLFGNCHLNRDFPSALLQSGFRAATLTDKSMPLPIGRIVYGSATIA